MPEAAGEGHETSGISISNISVQVAVTDDRPCVPTGKFNIRTRTTRKQ